MKDGYLQTPGIAYRTNSFDPSKKTLVFIHGLSGSASAWAPFEEALQNSHNIVTYDLRGHGLSKRYAKFDDYPFEKYADDLAALLAHLAIERCAVVAHSMGSLVAVAFMHQSKAAVESVFFLAPNYRLGKLARAKIVRPIVALYIGILSLFPFTPKPGKRLDYANFGYSWDLSLKRIAPEIRILTPRIYSYCLSHVYSFDKDSWWHGINVPTTIIQGTKDTFVPAANSAELAKNMPHAKLIQLRGANHMLVLNNKKEILDAILNQTK